MALGIIGLIFLPLNLLLARKMQNNLIESIRLRLRNQALIVALTQQKEVADGIIREMSQDKAFGTPIVTEVLPLSNYWPAEDYHQDFFERNPYQGYCLAVAAPKVSKFRKTFAALARD